jgi:hypothetical protein
MTSFEKIQKAALARLEAEEDLEHILQDYADYEDELRPILQEAAGVSIVDLMQNPRPKSKIKAKNEPNKALAPLMLIAVAVLGAVIYLLLGVNSEPEIIPATPIDPTTVPPTTVSQLVPVDDGQCDMLGQQSVNYIPAQQEPQFGSGSSSGTTSGGMVVETTPAAAVGLALPTASPAGTGAPMPESAAPVLDTMALELPPASGGGSSSGTSGTTGAGGAEDTSLVTGDRGGGDTSSSTTSESGSGGIVAMSPTAESPADERDMDDDTDDYSDTETERGLAATGEYAEEESPMEAPASSNQVVLQPLNAGEIDDNADWDTYQTYRRDFLSMGYYSYGVRDLDITDRQIISVVDSNGLPVLGACVQVYNGESFITASRTYATGLTLFFPNLNDRTRYLESFRVVVTKAGTYTEATIDRGAVGGLTTVTLPISQTQSTVQLDVLFLLDATGSMGDEIEQLQTNILSISAQLDTLPNDVDVRFGLVSYKDRGDEYVTRVYDFTGDVQAFQSNLMMVAASGGGDYPEALNEGFTAALNSVNWRGEDAIKLIFLVTDAPPQLEYTDDVDYNILMQDALARGIKVHPIGGSQLGDSPEGEYILRQIAQYTMGHFLFLTYENGVTGTSGEERTDLNVGEARDEQGVGDYSVAQLDELVLRLITDEISALQGQ